MKRMLTVLAAVMAAAVVQVAAAAGLSFTIADDGKTADFAFEASHLQRKLYVAYGLSDGGSSTNGWENVELVATIPAGVTALDDVALPAGFGVDAPVMRPFIEKPMTAADYASEDLILLYDGIENAGWGRHDADATTWRNLVAAEGKTDTDLAIDKEGDAVADDHVALGNVARTTAGDVLSAADNFQRDGIINAQNMTLELNAQVTWLDSNNKNDIHFFIAGGSSRMTFDNRCSFAMASCLQNSSLKWHMIGYGYGKVSNYLEDGLYRTFTGSTHIQDYKWCYVNGVSQERTNNPYSTADDRPGDSRTVTLGNSRIKLNIRSVRVYKGYFSAADNAKLVQNKTVDEARFGGKIPLEGASALGYAKVPFSVKNVVVENNAIKSIDVVFTGKDMPRRLYLAYARRDAGISADNWQNVVKVCNVTSGMAGKTIVLSDLGITLPDSNGFRVFMDCTSADDYAKDNLILLYDGIENAGWGRHDADATTWRNLVAAVGKTDTDLAIDKEGDAVADDHVALGNVARTTAGDVLSAADNFQRDGIINAQNMTLELNAQVTWLDSNNKNDIHFFIAGGSSRMTFDNRCSFAMACCMQNSSLKWHMIGYGYGKVSNYLEDGLYRTFTGSTHIQDYKWCWVNGVSQERTNNPYAEADGRPGDSRTITLGNSRIKLNIRSVRIYKDKWDKDATRALLARNYEVDETRFGNGGPVHVEEVTDFWKVRRGLFIVVQ